MKRSLLLFGSAAFIFLVVLILFIFSSRSYDSNLDFSYGPCNNSINTFDESSLGIQEFVWLTNDSLQVKAHVSLNCVEKIKRGNYEMTGDSISLLYKASTCGGLRSCARCMCAHELVYVISDLDKKDYSFILESI